MALDLDWIRARLPGRQVVWFETTDSTMTEAARLAAAGCASGTIAGAEEQTAGQGRHGRRWHSEPGTGICASWVLRLPLPSADMPPLTLALGLAAAEAIRHETGLHPDIRWPNDLLLDEKKCGGILVTHRDGAFIAGIGINVNQAAFPADLALSATSLRLATGREHPRERLLVRLAESVDGYCRVLVEQGTRIIVARFSGVSSYALGKRVVVEREGGRLEGVTDGLDPAGFLTVRQDTGERTVILAGGVRPA